MQGMLQRFRTLFNLPSMIRANISKGEYDLAIREYKKAKSLVLYSHVRQIAFCFQITVFHADREKKALLHSLQYLFHHYLMCTAWRMAGNLRSQSCYMLQVGILSRVLEEVDKIIQQFKDMLYKKMEDPHVEISQV